MATTANSTPRVIEDEDAPHAPPFSGPFFQAIASRKADNRDAKILITADHGQTGVGKTACGVYLAKALDTSATGFDAAEQSTLDVQEFLERYQTLPEGSVSILDEAEQLDARRAMSHENVDASHEWQMRRVNEIIAILILPSPRTIDERMEMLADFWINIECRGRAKIYQKKTQRMPPRNVYYETMQTFEWPNMDGDEDYQILASLKDDRLEGESESDYVRQSEVAERIRKAREEAAREKRDEVITALYEMDDISSEDIASAVGLSSGRVRQIANGS